MRVERLEIGETISSDDVEYNVSNTPSCAAFQRQIQPNTTERVQGGFVPGSGHHYGARQLFA